MESLQPVTRTLPVLAALVACNADVNLGGLPSTDSSGGTADPSETSCGDGVVQGDEECDINGADADGCLSTCELATSCRQIQGDAPDAGDGVYTIDPDGAGPNVAFAAYCDMKTDGGGWTLLAKVHRWHGGELYDEPSGWFALERDTEALLDPISYESRFPGSASHGEARMGPMIPGVTLARFTLIAEDDSLQRATWFKGVDTGIWAWFSANEHASTLVCTDLAMTQDCWAGKIRSDGEQTMLAGMLLSHHGYSLAYEGCTVAMRLPGDSSPESTSVCSCTLDRDNNAWNDDATSEHWGNGLEIWLR